MTTPLLELRQLRVAYGRAQVLFGIDLSVSMGEVVTLLGRNGMGRSTTVKCLSGLLPVTGGTMTFNQQRTELLPSFEIATFCHN